MSELNDSRLAHETMADRPVRVSVNVNGSKPKNGEWSYHAILWINGYAFTGIDWPTHAEAERDAELARNALALKP